MLTHYFTLRSLVDEIGGKISGAALREIFTQRKNELAMTIQTRTGEELSIVASILTRSNALYLEKGRIRAKKNSVDIFPSVHGRTLEAIRVGHFERVITIDLSGGYRLEMHLFNSTSSNILLVDGGDTIRSAFKNERALVDSPYRLKTGGFDPELPGDMELFRTALLREETVATDMAMKKMAPFLGPIYLRELFFRCGVDPKEKSGQLEKREVQSLSNELRNLIMEADSPRPTAYAQGEDAPLLFSVHTLRHLADAVAEIFPTVNDGIRSLVHRTKHDSKARGEKEQILESVRREEENLRKTVKEVETQISRASGAPGQRKFANLILSNLHLLHKGMTQAEFPDPAERGATIRIPLDRTKSPAENANSYFEGAKKLERAEKELDQRLILLRQRLDDVASLLSEVEACEDPAEMKSILARHRRSAPPGRSRSRDGRDSGDEHAPFRIFPLGEHFEAWVGKSSTNNDLLTMKYAGPHDYWLHARGASGSHVVVKAVGGGKTPVPKEILVRAARIAAYYSKMRKAGMVPVAYCQRKYVKKPKNAPPGTVVLQREEILFVEPGLP